MNTSWEIEIEGHRLAVVLAHSADAGIPVFFLHGIGGSAYFWTTGLTTPFHDIGPCYSLSLPGHFPAAFPEDFPQDCLTAELIARLITGALQKIVGNQRVLLVGHSTGGFAALSIGIYHPEAVAGIVSVAGFAHGQWAGALGFNQWLVRQGTVGRALFKKIYQFGGLNRAIFRMYWHVYVNDHTALWKYPPARAVVDRSFPYLQKLNLESIADYFTVMPHTDITSRLSEISAPTCLIAGDKDPIVPPAQSITIAGKVKSAKLNILKGAGHLPFFERPVEYEKAITNWLTEFPDPNRSSL